MADQNAHDPLLGTRVHDYLVERLLDQGGMGAVYLCRHAELPHICKVLKVISSELTEELDQAASPSVRAERERTRAFLLDRFEREAVAVSKLAHRFIAPIDGIGTVGGRRYILMPFLEGGSLEQVLRARGCLAPHETLHIAAQIARALDHAHHRLIVHRDLKPANVFIVPTEDDPLAIKVIDFGIAKQMQTQAATAWRGPMGTLHFMAPEQFEHASQVTAAADVYSLAVMVYLMITGRYPWGEAESAFALYRRQMTEQPSPAPAMPPGWEAQVVIALSPDPHQRPQSMRAFVHPLASLLPAGSLTASVPGFLFPSLSQKSGREILRAVARGWVESAVAGETLRGTGARRAPVSGVWSAASSGAWPAATSGSSGPWSAVGSSGSWSAAGSSGSWSAAGSSPAVPLPEGSWPPAAGSWPPGATVTTSEWWPSTATAHPSETTSATLDAADGRTLSIWRLVLLAAMTAVLAGIVVAAMAAFLRARSGPSSTPTTTAPAAP
jgi:eukaryotic-like serine/threonine-protein kinase